MKVRRECDNYISDDRRSCGAWSSVAEEHSRNEETWISGLKVGEKIMV